MKAQLILTKELENEMKLLNQDITENENISVLTNTIREVDQNQEINSPETGSTLPIKSQATDII